MYASGYLSNRKQSVIEGISLATPTSCVCHDETFPTRNSFGTALAEITAA